MSTASVMRSEMRVSSARNLLMDRVGVLLRRSCRGIGMLWTRWRAQTRRKVSAPKSSLLAAVIGRAMSAKGAHGRLLAVEERLTLGPKQHMYLIRCGDQRLLVASAGEAALQWMALPGEGKSDHKPKNIAEVACDAVAKSGPKRRVSTPRVSTTNTKRRAERAQ